MVSGILLKATTLVVIVVAFTLAFYYYGDADVFRITGTTIVDDNIPGPADRIREEQIIVNEHGVAIDVENVVIGTFEDTKSMSPVLDSTANAILTKPESYQDIKVGDIISYFSEEAQGLVAHRVVHISSDAQGWYALAKGDNTNTQDPSKIRFDQLKYVVVGILY